MLRSALVVLLAASGCVTVGSMQPASTLGRGNVVGGIESSAWGVFVPDGRYAQQAGISTVNVLPSGSGVFRVGVSDRVDLGLRAGFNGLELHGKVMFTEPGAKFIVSLAPALQGYYFPSISGTNAMGQTMTTDNFGLFSVPIPVLLGLRLGDHELVFGVREVNQVSFLRAAYANAPTISVYTMMFGASAGIALKFGDSFMLMPEIAVQVPVWQTAATMYGTVSGFGVGIVQATAGVGCLFGKVAAKRAPPPPEETWDEKPPPPPAPAQPQPAQPQPQPQREELPPDIAPPPPPPPLPPPGAN